MKTSADTDTAARWEVASASHTPGVSYYFVVHSSSNEEATVIVTSRKRRKYTWNDKPRAKEEVPSTVRREIDKALVRYLSSSNL